jgi:hypothetical protein
MRNQRNSDTQSRRRQDSHDQQGYNTEYSRNRLARDDKFNQEFSDSDSEPRYRRDNEESRRAYGQDPNYPSYGMTNINPFNANQNFESPDRYNKTANRDFQSPRSQVQIPSHAGKGPKGYKRSDERIREDASEALFQDPQVDASNIELDVNDGIITLSGTVESRLAKRQAEDCVYHVSGVNDVINNIRIETKSFSRKKGSH